MTAGLYGISKCYGVAEQFHRSASKQLQQLLPPLSFYPSLHAQLCFEINPLLFAKCFIVS